MGLGTDTGPLVRVPTMGTGMGTSPECQVADERLWV